MVDTVVLSRFYRLRRCNGVRAVNCKWLGGCRSPRNAQAYEEDDEAEKTLERASELQEGRGDSEPQQLWPETQDDR